MGQSNHNLASLIGSRICHDLISPIGAIQVFFRLKFFRTDGAPARLYAEGREGGSYRGQDLTPARCFRTG